jgi:glutathione S-transferase
MLSEQISRLHDIYISPIQGAMYKAVGTPFSIYGTDRKAALAELKRQLFAIDSTVQSFDDKYPECKGNYLCGKEISLADAALFPTIVFCMFMLPQFFGWQESDFLGPRLSRWYKFFATEVEAGKVVKKEIEDALIGWKNSGRWDPIVADMAGK